MLGDVFGSPGRRCLDALVMDLRRRHQVELVVANGENAAGGLGITPPLAREMWGAGVDIITTGNHVFKQKEIIPFLDQEPNILRPANFPPQTPGRGWQLWESASGVRVGVLNLQGLVYMDPLDCPFRTARQVLDGELARAQVILVDMHAEATSEKQALAWYLDGRVSALVGTHTHVQTADQRILPGGTAYISDLGLTGAQASVIGLDPDSAIKRFLSRMPTRFKVAKKEPRLQGVLLEIDPQSGRALAIERLDVDRPGIAGG